ncbi:ankyrin repeat domain-containing protein [Stieleria sp. JC731]|uniref:ankyrin repeat domain-containing protein n=1 Tax=Pirellulaceae TaxID=2691357 RepID=UPI001E3915AE|nr:ankyrin repeat domain-containing protein [Stieleria sp. JC731]MCC9600560.1 ankyrin repeat domain-containing protein [Stieleria sp. JC731]
MNEVQQAAFELQLLKLKQFRGQGYDLAGTLLAACSAHDPHADRQTHVIRYLIQEGVSVNETDKNGVTPLHRAVRFRSLAATVELIQAGANVNAVDKRSGSTALHRAVTQTGAPSTKGKRAVAVEIIKCLLGAGVDHRLRNKVDKTAMDYIKSDQVRSAFGQICDG